MSESVDPNLIEARRWLQQAEEHLAAVRCLGQGNLWAPACFQAQQTGEVALKAVLIRQGERAIHTHSVLGLVRRVSNDFPEYRPLIVSARLLDRFYLPTRYPNGLIEGTAAENFGREDYDVALEAAEAIIRAARNAVR